MGVCPPRCIPQVPVTVGGLFSGQALREVPFLRQGKDGMVSSQFLSFAISPIGMIWGLEGLEADLGKGATMRAGSNTQVLLDCAWKCCLRPARGFIANGAPFRRGGGQGTPLGVGDWKGIMSRTC